MLLYFNCQEARRNPELNPKISAYEALLPYKDDPDIYISFTKVDKIGINPQSNYNTPLGIYTYPLKEVWKEYEFDTTKSPGNSVPFAGNSPFIWILRRKRGVKFIEDLYNTYTSKDYDEDYRKLENYFKGFPLTGIESIARKTSKHQNPSGIMWNLTRLIADNMAGGNKKAMVQWNTLLYKVLGYHGIADKDGRGIIHSAEPIQAVFLTTRGFEVVGQIYNKDYVKDNKAIFVEIVKKFYKNNSYNKKLQTQSLKNELKSIIYIIYSEMISLYRYSELEVLNAEIFPISDSDLKKAISIVQDKYIKAPILPIDEMVSLHRQGEDFYWNLKEVGSAFRQEEIGASKAYQLIARTIEEYQFKSFDYKKVLQGFIAILFEDYSEKSTEYIVNGYYLGAFFLKQSESYRKSLIKPIIEFFRS